MEDIQKSQHLVLASVLRELGDWLYEAYANQSFCDTYEDIALKIIDKLSQRGVYLTHPECTPDKSDKTPAVYPLYAYPCADGT